ncbi:hypothetical protein U27_01617 [Candidatus Vecturithrix granuli]|uniref:Uncharacterized protein n=1 Tax=Vecturithrix granuli TaxID=1499967 RepID=A0A0S6W9N0_VECG1|nr:hypothetical protein U27_01617 [Candidatus Vecturithrix granuli]
MIIPISTLVTLFCFMVTLLVTPSCERLIFESQDLSDFQEIILETG